MKRSKSPHFLLFILIPFLFIVISVELTPFEVHHSSVLTSADTTDYQLYVIMNTFLPVDRDQAARQIVESHKRINGSRAEAFYEIRLYRTRIHYYFHVEYDVLYCDDSGKLI